MGPSEKGATKLACGLKWDTFSGPVLEQNLQNCGNFSGFSSNIAGVLCNPDCVAEGEGFEPPVRFCQAKPRHIRKLQIAKPDQRISH